MGLQPTRAPAPQDAHVDRFPFGCKGGELGEPLALWTRGVASWELVDLERYAAAAIEGQHLVIASSLCTILRHVCTQRLGRGVASRSQHPRCKLARVINGYGCPRPSTSAEATQSAHIPMCAPSGPIRAGSQRFYLGNGAGQSLSGRCALRRGQRGGRAGSSICIWATRWGRARRVAVGRAVQRCGSGRRVDPAYCSRLHQLGGAGQWSCE